MDKAQALHEFWSSFDIPAIDEQSAYDEGVLEQLGISYPYITYEAATDSFDNSLMLSADIWYNSTSWKDISWKALEIANDIGMGGKLVHYDGGAIWITRSTPFASRMTSDSTNDIRRIHININAEFLSA